MKAFLRFTGLVVLAVLGSIALAAILRAQEPEETRCGDEQVTCGSGERCCEHVVAIFSGDAQAAPSYVEGKCVAQEQRCADFWCGNRHCESGFFGTPSVCCIDDKPGEATEYRCAHSELSCPGNTQQLSIRDHAPDRRLQGG